MIDTSIDQDGSFRSGPYSVGFDIHNGLITFAVFRADSLTMVAHGTIKPHQRMINMEQGAMRFIESRKA